MEESSFLRKCLAICAAALMLQCAPAIGDQTMPPQPEGVSVLGHGLDWMEHTQHTLEELKGKLNLVPGQLPAWEAWSGGVTRDAHQQLKQKTDLQVDKPDGTEKVADRTTPNLMQGGIERLRVEINWLQEHLVQLEAAQARTKTFYDVLDTNQKTISVYLLP